MLGGMMIKKMYGLQIIHSMETPKNVFIEYKGYGVFDEGSTTKTSDQQIEYINKDIFIKSTCDAYCKVCGHYSHTVPTHICRQNCNYYNDFRRYLIKECKE